VQSGRRKREAAELTVGAKAESEFFTFQNTKRFEKLVKKPREEKEEVEGEKYEKGKCSVKGLHYRKYITFELLVETHFAVGFHKFFS